MLRKKFKNSLLVIGILLIYSGCSTSRSALLLIDSPIKIAEEEGISITVRYLDEETLINKYGKKGNPFLTPYHTLQFKRIMVFDIRFKNSRQESIELILNRMELQFGGKAVQPTNRFHLAGFWEFRDDIDETKRTDRQKKERAIKKYVLPNSISIRSGGTAKGYAVFMGNLPRYGQASVYIPLLREKTELIHNFNFLFEF